MPRTLKAVRDRTKVLVSGSIALGATSTNLNAGEGAKLPVTGTEGSFYLTIYDSSLYSDPADDPNAENLLVTSRSTDALTHSAATKDHTSVGSQYIGFVSFPKAEIDAIDLFLQRLVTGVTSYVRNSKGQVTSVVTAGATFTLTYNQYTGRLATVSDGTITRTIAYNVDGSISTIS